MRIDQLRGGHLLFTNDKIEEPIGDFSVCYVTKGTAPKGVKQQEYSLTPGYCSTCAEQNELRRPFWAAIPL